MEYLPLFLNAERRLVVMVGAGKIALRKIKLLRRAGACVKIVSPQVSAEIRSLLDQDENINWIERPYQTADIQDAFLVVAATNDATMNETIAKDCHEAGIPVNRVDDVEDSDIIFPGSFTRPPIQIAVSSVGASPLLARLLVQHLERCTPKAYAELAQLLQRYRDRAKNKLATAKERKVFWEGILQSQVADLAFRGRMEEAEELLKEILENRVNTQGSLHDVVGEVYLVGAGPGDPDLLTLKALRLMQQAEVVFYDRLVSQRILDLLGPDVERIYAGKARSQHSIPQQELNQMLVRYARQGKRVLRLKGGDPFIFGRGGEEIQTLMQQQVPFQVVPGITAASGCSAYAGIPLTHRDYAHTCLFVAGHLKDGTINLDWDHLVKDKQTVVFYMGLHTLNEICHQLLKHGMATHMPCALIAHGTTEKQLVLTGELETFPQQVAETEVTPPTLLIVGEVVKLHQSLSWFTT